MYECYMLLYYNDVGVPLLTVLVTFAILHLLDMKNVKYMKKRYNFNICLHRNTIPFTFLYDHDDLC